MMFSLRKPPDGSDAHTLSPGALVPQKPDRTPRGIKHFSDLFERLVKLGYNPEALNSSLGTLNCDCGIVSTRLAGVSRCRLRFHMVLLEGSWDLVSKVISRITPLRGLITLLITYLLSPMIL